MQITVNGTTHNATTVQDIVDTLQTLEKCRARYSRVKKLVTINAYQSTACADIKATIPIETDDNLHDIALALEDCCNKPCIFDGDMSEGWFQFMRIY